MILEITFVFLIIIFLYMKGLSNIKAENVLNFAIIITTAMIVFKYYIYVAFMSKKYKFKF